MEFTSPDIWRYNINHVYCMLPFIKDSIIYDIENYECRSKKTNIQIVEQSIYTIMILSSSYHSASV